MVAERGGRHPPVPPHVTHRPMINGKKIVVVMPAYNAEKTLEQT